jgi:hypothetical protein
MSVIFSFVPFIRFDDTADRANECFRYYIILGESSHHCFMQTASVWQRACLPLCKYAMSQGSRVLVCCIEANSKFLVTIFKESGGIVSICLADPHNM